MPITTFYSVITGHIQMPTYMDEASGYSAVTGLSNGGFAAIAQDADGYADLAIYDANYNLIAANSQFRVTGAKIVQLANGNIAVVGVDASGASEYRIFTVTGQLVDTGISLRESTTAAKVSNLVANPDGTFNYIEEDDLNAGNHTLNFVTHNLDGTSSSVAIGTAIANNDPSLTRLTNGNYVAAWDQPGSGGTIAMSYEVFTAAGAVVHQALAFDSGGTVNRAPSVTALAGGGFSIAYEDNAYSSGGNGESDITEALFDVSGTPLVGTQLETLTGSDSQAFSITLSDGLVLVGFSAPIGGGDVRAALYNPVTHTILSNTLYIASGGAFENAVSMSAMTHDSFAASYTISYMGNKTFAGVNQLKRQTTGDDAGDTIVGDTMYDQIATGSGNDVITGGDGADNYIDAGQGFDTVNFSGARAGYTITRSGYQTFVKRPDGGTDTVNFAEKLHFADQDFFTPPATRDLNGFGVSAMVLQNTAGEIRVWSINGDGTLLSTDRTSTTPSAAWKVVGTGQFNSATDSHADILMQNSNGNVQVYEMNGYTVTATVKLGSVSAGWKLDTTGDFNGDGQADIVMEDTNNGQIRVWMMNGTTVTAKVDVGAEGYKAIATGDFNGDGKSDILAQHNSQVYVWLMNGSTRLETDKVGASLATGVQAISSGDFNGDGKSDILLWNSNTGAVSIWEMNGANIIATVQVGTASAGYHPTGSGDFNGDGISDIVFQKSDGHVQEWLMAGGAVSSKLTVGNPGSTWTLVAGTGG